MRGSRIIDSRNAAGSPPKFVATSALGHLYSAPMDLIRLNRTAAHPAVMLVRLAVGGTFLSEGIQKFLFAPHVGAGRFEKIGFPLPELLAPVVGGFEILGGSLLLLGWMTRLASIPLIGIMLTAIASTKIPILLGHGYLGFGVRETSYGGLWGMLHEWRTDFAMLMGSLFLLIRGAGRWSIDALLGRNLKKAHVSEVSEPTAAPDAHSPAAGGDQPTT